MTSYKPQSFPMTILYLLFITILGHMVSQTLARSTHLRYKRNIAQMCTIMRTYTNKPCLEYDKYGCFCGYGGAGIRPVDGVDRCCMAHDECYSRVSCYFFSAHVIFYSYDCTENNTCVCLDQDACNRSSCDCDLKFAECLSRVEYKLPYKNYDRRLCPMW